jgi:hypothetical protein
MMRLPRRHPPSNQEIATSPQTFFKREIFIRAPRNDVNLKHPPSNYEIATSPKAFFKRETLIMAPRNDVLMEIFILIMRLPCRLKHSSNEKH